MKNNTEQKNIPQGWILNTISGLCDNLDNKRVPITKSDRISGSIPYYGATGIIDYVDDYIFDEEILLIGEDGADWNAFSDKAFVVRGRSWVNNHAHVLKCENSILSKYLEQYLNWKNLDIYTTGGTRKKLNKEVLMNIVVCLPENELERQKISDILGTMDEDITKTQEVIEKTEKLKKGLIQELFTCGIGHTKFKKTKLGEIPEEWETVYLSKLIKLTSGKGLSKNQFIPGEFSVYGGNGISGTHNEYLLKKPTITIGRVGEYCGSVHLTKPYSWVTDNALYIERYLTEIEQTFLFYLLNFLNLNQYAKVGGQPSISQDTVGRLQIGLPHIAEQKKIADILSSVNEKILVNKKLKAKLTKLKKGLMQDLLSGRVRTKYGKN